MILSKWPAALPPQPLPDPERCVAVDLLRPSGRPLRIVNAYLDAVKVTARVDQGIQLGAWTAEHQEDTLIVGDWNCPPVEAPASQLVSSGGFEYAATQLAHPCCPPTHQKRCIDFGIFWGAVPVHAHDQGIGISDHHWVSYDVDSAPPPPVISWPKPANIQPIKVCDLPDRWASAWADTQPSFLAALLDEDVELAWSLLSHAAEMALGEEGGGGQARGQCTIPTTCPVVSRESKEVQSIRCRRLERTLRRWQDGLAKQ